MTVGIGRTYTKNIYMDSPCAMATWIRCISDGSAYISNIYVKSAFIRGIEPSVGSRRLLRLGIILASPKVNDYYFILFMVLIFTLTNSASHCFINT